MRLVSGMKPTGRLHLGNLEGALRTWVRLQQEHELFCFVADWHALTSGHSDASEVRTNTLEVVMDFLAAGLDPKRCAIFVQSDVKQHAELALLLGMLTPVSWLERVPSYKAAEAHGYGFLGYPGLQAADILIYRAEAVPIGRDQLPHLELTREIVRRFHHLYGLSGALFPEPAEIVSESDVLPGLDGRKMSKSYGNVIYLSDSDDETSKKVMNAFTTPSKIRASDPGVPETCVVCQLRRVYDPHYDASWQLDREGKRGCAENKRELVEIMNSALAPLRARRKSLEPELVKDVLQQGAARARFVAEETMRIVRERMGVR